MTWPTGCAACRTTCSILGADLCVPETDPPPEYEPLRVAAEQIETLEGWIDAVNERLEPLESFILPGGTPAAAHLHHARAVCRRAETQVLRLSEERVDQPQRRHLPESAL